MFASPKEPDDITRLNHTGTHPAHTDLAIANAIEFHNRIGGTRKEARLRYLQNYWTDQAREMDHLTLFTPKDRHRSCGIANVGIARMESSEMAKKLMDEHGIFAVSINTGGVNGCRISPNVFTSIEELDALIAALKSMG